MAPFYQRYKRNLKLHQDDIKAIQVRTCKLEVKRSLTSGLGARGCIKQPKTLTNSNFIGDLWHEEPTEVQSKWPKAKETLQAKAGRAGRIGETLLKSDLIDRISLSRRFNGALVGESPPATFDRLNLWLMRKSWSFEGAALNRIQVLS